MFRIVTVSALAHEKGQIYWDDLGLKKDGAYGPVRAYIQSKIANILFSAELGEQSPYSEEKLRPKFFYKLDGWDRDGGSGVPKEDCGWELGSNERGISP
jgi:hypothetical protein